MPAAFYVAIRVQIVCSVAGAHPTDRRKGAKNVAQSGTKWHTLAAIPKAFPPVSWDPEPGSWRWTAVTVTEV